MEFAGQLEGNWSETALQESLTIAALPRWCASIEKVLEDGTEWGRIFTVWGTFAVHRLPIRGGVRFTLPECPNALSWSITTGLAPDPARVVVHATIHRPWHEPDFVASLEDFVTDWVAGLAQGQ